jgi:hypothetical protein
MQDSFGLPIVEPATMMTDYMITVLAWLLGWRIYFGGKSDCQKWWAVVFALIGLSAFLGGTHHGFQRVIDPATNELIWESTRWIVFFVSLAMLIGHSKAVFDKRFTNLVTVFALIKLLVFLFWALSDSSFLVAIADYLPVLLFILIAELFMWKTYATRESKFLVAGVVVSLLGAAGQQAGIGISEHFNHNDVYHVVTLVALYLFYLGVINLKDFKDRPTVSSTL